MFGELCNEFQRQRELDASGKRSPRVEDSRAHFGTFVITIVSMLMTMEQTKLRKSRKNKTAPRRSDSCCIKMAARNSLVKRTLASLAKEANGRRPAPLWATWMAGV